MLSAGVSSQYPYQHATCLFTPGGIFCIGSNAASFSMNAMFALGGGNLWGVIEKIVDAARGSVDLLAFILIVILAAWIQTQGNDIIATAAFVAICYAIWIVGRVLLLSVQSKERLRDFRENAKVRALDVLTKHADANEISEIVKKLTKDDSHDGR